MNMQYKEAHELPARLTVVESIYYQQSGQQPVQHDCQHYENVYSDEQPYLRNLKIGSDWQPIDHGWLTSWGLLLVSNEEGKGLLTVPTLEEQEEINSRVLQLGIALDSTNDIKKVQLLSTIPPGRSMRWYPENLLNLRLRCQHGKARCRISLFPTSAAS